MADETGRIILTPTGDGTHYRMDVEGGDVEGHGARASHFSVEPDGTDADGAPLFRLTGDDAEGHTARSGR